MKYLITGGAGFIGSHLCEALLAAGHKVTILDDLSTGNFKNVEHLAYNENFTAVIDTIANEATVAECVRGCDEIFHLAAAVGVELIVERPVNTIVTNIRGTEIVLEQACRYRKKTLITSTSEIYGKSARDFFNEDDDMVLGPTNRCRWSYAASKAVDEFLALAYHIEKHFPVVIARLFNTVGPRQTGRYGMVVPRFVGQAVSGEPITIYGTGEQTRCFCHVKDVVGALVELMQRRECIGQVFNVGNDQEISMNALAKKILELTGSASGIKHVPYEEAYGPGFEDMQRRRPDVGKLRNLLGAWQPRPLEAVLQDVIQEKRESTSLK